LNLAPEGALNTMPTNDVQLILSREESTMVSTWEEHLGLLQMSNKLWRIGTFVYQWIGSIYDLIPESQLYSDDGELIVPEEWDGKKIIGLADGEYLQTNELDTADYVEFAPKSMKSALEFCKSRGWAAHPNFELAWLQIEASVKPFEPLSKRQAFKNMPLLRAGSSASLGGYCTTELAIYRGQSETQFWIWNSESESECLYKTASILNFGQILQTLLDDESFSIEIDWFDFDVSGLNESQGVVMASALAFDEGSKAAAQLMAKIPDQTLLPFLNQVTLEGIGLGELGQNLLDYANNHEISLNDIESVKPRRLADFQSLKKSLMGALSRAARRQSRAESDRENLLAPFAGTINRLVEAYRKDKPNGYYPGVGYVVPPSGVFALRDFLNDYALKHQALPKGVVQIPYKNKAMDKPSCGIFTVDIDSLLR
jgi:hypothetical protein